MLKTTCCRTRENRENQGHEEDREDQGDQGDRGELENQEGQGSDEAGDKPYCRRGYELLQVLQSAQVRPVSHALPTDGNKC